MGRFFTSKFYRLLPVVGVTPKTGITSIMRPIVAPETSGELSGRDPLCKLTAPKMSAFWRGFLARIFSSPSTLMLCKAGLWANPDRKKP